MTDMTDLPEIHRPLTDDERSCIMQLAIAVVMYRMGCTEEAAAAVLDGIDCELKASTTEAAIYSNGHRIVRCARDWLAFTAMNPDIPIDLADYDDKKEEGR